MYHYCITVDINTHLAGLMVVLNDTACQWNNLGLQLGLNYFTLDAIEVNHRGVVHVCMSRMLIAWLKGQGGECTKHTLRTALSKINCRIVD